MRRSSASALKYAAVVLTLLAANLLIFRSFLRDNSSDGSDPLLNSRRDIPRIVREQEEQLDELERVMRDEDYNDYEVKDGQRAEKSFEDLMTGRTKEVRSRCDAMRLHPTEPFPHFLENLFYLEKEALLWCPVFKAASTVWMEHFFSLADVSAVRRGTVYHVTFLFFFRERNVGRYVLWHLSDENEVPSWLQLMHLLCRPTSLSFFSFGVL